MVQTSFMVTTFSARLYLRGRRIRTTVLLGGLRFGVRYEDITAPKAERINAAEAGQSVLSSYKPSTPSVTIYPGVYRAVRTACLSSVGF